MFPRGWNSKPLSYSLAPNYTTVPYGFQKDCHHVMLHLSVITCIRYFLVSRFSCNFEDLGIWSKFYSTLVYLRKLLILYQGHINNITLTYDIKFAIAEIERYFVFYYEFPNCDFFLVVFPWWSGMVMVSRSEAASIWTILVIIFFFCALRLILDYFTPTAVLEVPHKEAHHLGWTKPWCCCCNWFCCQPSRSCKYWVHHR